MRKSGPKIDKDPTCRSQAVFAREEVEQLISDERIPEDRRAIYAVAFLAGLRTGEVSALRFRAYDASLEPLGRLHIAASFDTYARVEKCLKTGKPREVPVHPTLAKILAAWKLTGWREMMGRSPGPDDLVVPKPDGQHRDAHFTLYWFRRDCELLGLRKRRQYNARRTFVSLAQADGARKDILRWISHRPRGRHREPVHDAAVARRSAPKWRSCALSCAKADCWSFARLPRARVTVRVTLNEAKQKNLAAPPNSSALLSVPDGIRTLFRQLN